MYSLVYFENEQSYFVCPSRNVIKTNNGEISVKYKNRGIFVANLVHSNDDKRQLCTLKYNLEHQLPKIVLTRNTQSHSSDDHMVSHLYESNQYYPQNCSPLVMSFPESKSKRYFCLFCQKKVTKFARHLERLHGEEKEVKAFMVLPKGCKERLHIIDVIRKNGNFIYNTNKNYNEGDLLVCRRPQKSSKISVQDMKCCPSCKGYFSKVTLRRHYIKCNASAKKGDRNVSILSRKVHCDIHMKASIIVRDTLFPILREDEVTRLLRYDELLIIFANKQCIKYRAHYHHKMIRARLRLLGRLLLNIKKINPAVTDFSSIYSPDIYDSFIEAVNLLAQISNDGSKFKCPAVAANLGTNIKQVGRILISECIKQKNEEKKKLAGQFLELLNEDYGISINKTVSESQAEYARQKNICLPTMDDIQVLDRYIETNKLKTYNNLKRKFCFKDWKDLASYTLISLQLFNRRRAGELERALISDFDAHQKVDDDVNRDIQTPLSSEERRAARYYRRMCIRGKLGRIVPVLINEHNFKCLKLIIDNRNQAGVSPNNPYIFGLPSEKDVELRYLSACELLRKFSMACGARNPERLRGTELRKHIATRSAVHNFDDSQVSELANFLGHAESIHKQHYRISLPARQIVKTSKVLEDAIGNPSSNNHAIAQDSSLNESTCSEDHHGEDSTYVEDESDFLSDCSDSPSIIRKLSGRRNTKRSPWTGKEKRVAKKFFQENIVNKSLPSLAECSDVISHQAELSRRTPEQLKAWINNQIMRDRRIKQQLDESNIAAKKKQDIKKSIRARLFKKRC